MDKLIQPEVQKYIQDNRNADLHQLLLKKSPFPEVSIQEIVQQIKGKNIAEKKFPFFLKENIIFPPNLNLEQTSSEITAKYKAQLISGKSILDLTSGFGIDAFFMSEHFEKITLIEQNSGLLDIVKHNWNILERKAEFINSDLSFFLNDNSYFYDVIFLDPARRDSNKNKVFLLEDLSPNILDIQNVLLEKSNQVLIKLSPLIDIKYLTSVVKNCKEIYIVAVKNEVKEVLLSLTKDWSSQNIDIHCINLESNEPEFIFTNTEWEHSSSEFSDFLNYLYIPNNSVLKSGAFNVISERFELKKLHPNTQLYTSENLVSDFPGRVLKMQMIDAKEIKKGEQYNLISKNYPLKPEEIKKKYKLKDGGNQYLIFTQSIQGKIILKSSEI